MGEVYFYHLTRSLPEAVLAMLLDRALSQGWRTAVRVMDSGRADWLDQKLWLGPEDGFLPHGQAGGPHDALQPVLIGAGLSATGADCLMALDGAEVGADEARGVDRACILFDGNNPAEVEAARGQWRRLVAEAIAAKYWSEEGGRWQMKAQSGG